MKTRLLAIALVAVIVGLGACGGKDKKVKSSEKDMISVKVSTITYTKSGTTFTYTYPKSGPDTWATEPQWPAPAEITISPKATLSPPASEPQYFKDGVTYTVTAEDGTRATFTVKADRVPEL